MHTISSVLKTASKKIDRFDAELLLAHTLKKNREFVLTYPEHKISCFQKYKYLFLVQRRAQNIPLAYLTGHKEFFGFDFLVNKYTLVPRPDTEVLVEAVLSFIQGHNTVIARSRNGDVAISEIASSDTPPRNDSAVIVDIGTGSGCIPISIYKILQKQNSLLHTKFFATDISSKTLAIARKNAHKHFADITFFKGNLLEALDGVLPIREGDTEGVSSIILTANLPYLTQEQFDTEASIQHEPHLALVADDQGLALYKELLVQIQQFLQNHKTQLTCFFEVDPSQSQILSQYIQNIFPNSKTDIIKDLAGADRVVTVKFF